MITRETSIERWQFAKKRVAELKDFHNHVVVFVGFTILLYLVKGSVMEAVTQNNANVKEHFLVWLDLNFMLIPVIYGIGLLIYGLYAYRHKIQFLSRWEEKQVRKLMEEGQQASERINH